MLNFDEDRFIKIQAGAVGLSDGLVAVIEKCLDDGAENLFLVGAGGAGILMQPAAQILGARSRLPVFVPWAAELVTAGSAHLGPASIVVIPSLSGTTSESLAALAHCKALGATVITLTGDAGSPLAAGSDHNFTNFAENDTSSESFYLQSLVIALAVLLARGEAGDLDVAGALTELRGLPGLLVEVKRAAEPRAAAIAAAIAADDYHIFTGAGSAWPQAFYYGMCILEEMQWIRTRPVHAADFFHGTLELLEPNVSVVLLKGEDASRPLGERVEGFARQYTQKLTVLDAADYALPGISAAVRALISPVILATVLERVSAHIEVMRDHDLDIRRYYRKVAY